MVIIIIVNNCRIHKKNYAAHDYKQFKIHLESTRSVQATVNAKNWYSNKADLMKNLSLRNDQKIKKIVTKQITLWSATVSYMVLNT